MEKIAATLVVVAAFLLVILPCSGATIYTVGDSKGWTLGVNYTEWTAGKTFAVGDSLEFPLGSSHTIVLVNKTAYDSCSSDNTISFATNVATNITIPLNVAGEQYFICGTPGHCAQGMKMMITVSGSSAASPPGSNDAGGLSVRMMGVEVAVAFAAVVLFMA